MLLQKYSLWIEPKHADNNEDIDDDHCDCDDDDDDDDDRHIYK